MIGWRDEIIPHCRQAFERRLLGQMPLHSRHCVPLRVLFCCHREVSLNPFPTREEVGHERHLECLQSFEFCPAGSHGLINLHHSRSEAFLKFKRWKWDCQTLEEWKTNSLYCAASTDAFKNRLHVLEP